MTENKKYSTFYWIMILTAILNIVTMVFPILVSPFSFSFISFTGIEVITKGIMFQYFYYLIIISIIFLCLYGYLSDKKLYLYMFLGLLFIDLCLTILLFTSWPKHRLIIVSIIFHCVMIGFTLYANKRCRKPIKKTCNKTGISKVFSSFLKIGLLLFSASNLSCLIWPQRRFPSLFMNYLCLDYIGEVSDIAFKMIYSFFILLIVFILAITAFSIEKGEKPLCILTLLICLCDLVISILRLMMSYSPLPYNGFFIVPDILFIVSISLELISERKTLTS